MPARDSPASNVITDYKSTPCVLCTLSLRLLGASQNMAMAALYSKLRIHRSPHNTWYLDKFLKAMSTAMQQPQRSLLAQEQRPRSSEPQLLHSATRPGACI